MQQLGRDRVAGTGTLVIARSGATKQSIVLLRGEMDCFAEPVIGPRVRADPLARNDGTIEGRLAKSAVPYTASTL